MNEEEIINKINEIIEYGKLATDIGFADQKDKTKAIQGLLDLYNKEKEKNKLIKNKIRDLLDAYDAILNDPLSLVILQERIKELLEE